MKSSRSLALAVLLAASPLLPAQTPASPRSGLTYFDNVAEFTWAGRADIGEGTRPLGKIETAESRVAVVTATPLSQNTLLLAGVGAQWLAFQPPAGSLVPEHLGSLSVKLGVNYKIDDQWMVRADIDPGIYSDFGGGGGGFGAPAAFRVIYSVSKELQWAAGLNIDTRSGHPVVGGVGVRWQFAPEWTLALLLPAPRVEWAVTKELTLLAGASLHGGTFRVSDTYGRSRGRPALDGEIVDYREIAVGIGARWQLSKENTLSLGLGRMLDRRFEFHDRNLLLNGDGAPSAQIAFTSVF